MMAVFAILYRLRATIGLLIIVSALIAGEEVSTICGTLSLDSIEDYIIYWLCLGWMTGLLGVGTGNSADRGFAFEPNLGQADAQVEFVAHTAGMGILLDNARATLGFRRKDGADVVRLSFPGANPRPPAEAEDLQPGRSNYFLGNDPEKWLTDVPSFQRIRYRDLYPGIDVVYYGTGGALEHDFIVRPGADPSRIRMKFEGADDIRVDASGRARVSINGREILWEKPVLYQTAGPERHRVEGRYKQLDSGLGFEIGVFDPLRPLVIDPVVSYSSYFGKDRPEAAGRVAVDSQGNVYAVGITFDVNVLVTSGTYRSNAADGGSGNILLTKVNAGGSAPVYSTYIGGLRTDAGVSLAVDGDGSVYITGMSNSTDYPVTPGAFKRQFNPLGLPVADKSDCVITKLNAAGSALVYSTYLGSTKSDTCSGIAVDGQGNAYVSGFTVGTTDFPATRGAPQEISAGGMDAFIAKLNPAGTGLVYATYLGGSSVDSAFAIAVDRQGAAYIAGQTRSSANFPVTAGAAQSRYGGQLQNTTTSVGDAFVAKLNPAGTAFQYVTYLGGSAEDVALGIAVDGQDNAYVAGATSSANFPTTAGAYKTAYGGAGGNVHWPGGDAFAAKLNAAGSALLYSTFLGGDQSEWGTSIAVDSAGQAWVTGATLSANFPVTTDATQRTFGGTTGTGFPTGDIFVSQLNAAGSALVFSTFHGGRDEDVPLGIAVDARGDAYIAGTTKSVNFPVSAQAMQTTFGGVPGNNLPIGDAFLVKFGSAPPAAAPVSISNVASAASYAAGGVAPGEIVVITGSKIGPSAIAVAQPGAAGFPTTWAQTRVLFDGAPAPLIYVSNAQSSAIVPYAAGARQSTQMIVEFEGARSAPLNLPVVASKPALFSANSSGRGPGAILNQDFSVNTPANPAAPGSVVQLFGTGEGDYDPLPADGVLTAAPFPRLRLPVQVTIGGLTAPVHYAGAAPGAVAGLMQINVSVPDGAASGNQPVVVRVGDNSSQAGLTVAIR
jgi:uncharacterized protein (TIGR03437 family)